jgi:hypothetical protein
MLFSMLNLENNMKKASSNGGRPQKDIQPEMVEKLVSIGCTGDEIATVLGCCRDTLYARFSDSLKKGHNQAKIAIRCFRSK